MAWISEQDRKEAYLRLLVSLGFQVGEPVILRCPACGSGFWMRLPADLECRDGQVLLACALACGFYGEIQEFNLLASRENPFDTTIICRRHTSGVVYAADGAILRCPCCYIENPRAVMRQLVDYVEGELLVVGSSQRDRLEDLTGRIVATFDGVMRKMIEINHKNCAQTGKVPLPKIRSFQNLEAANVQLLTAGFSMSSQAEGWLNFSRLFQKRHLVAHRLGIVDQDYLDRTGDQTAGLGRRVSLASDEILAAAKFAAKIVDSFFACFLS